MPEIDVNPSSLPFALSAERCCVLSEAAKWYIMLCDSVHFSSYPSGKYQLFHDIYIVLHFFQHTSIQNFHFNSVKNNISIWEQSRIKYSNFLFFIPSPVMVWAWVGKEFSDMRQNEREIKFIRKGDIIRTACQFNRELLLNKGSLIHFIHGVQGLG